MSMPRDIGVIDLMMAIPNNDTSDSVSYTHLTLPTILRV